MLLLPLLLIGGGLAVAVSALLLAADDGQGPVPDHQPDLPASPPPPAGMTRYKLINKILGALQRAAATAGVPLGVLVGWVAVESGGKLGDLTSLDERGYFQLMPDESRALGVDHQRLSTDSDYSIEAGVKLVQHYANVVAKYGVAPQGSTYFWKLVKLAHTMGVGDTNKLVQGAKAAGQAGSWDAFQTYALGSPNPKPKHSPKKWFPLIAKMFDVGAPFGVGGDGGTTVAGYDDIPDPLDCLQRGGW